MEAFDLELDLVLIAGVVLAAPIAGLRIARTATEASIAHANSAVRVVARGSKGNQAHALRSCRSGFRNAAIVCLALDRFSALRTDVRLGVAIGRLAVEAVRAPTLFAVRCRNLGICALQQSPFDADREIEIHAWIAFGHADRVHTEPITALVILLAVYRAPSERIRWATGSDAASAIRGAPRCVTRLEKSVQIPTCRVGATRAVPRRAVSIAGAGLPVRLGRRRAAAAAAPKKDRSSA